MIRIGMAVNRVASADPVRCLESIGDLLARLEGQTPDLVVLPALALSSPDCGDLFASDMLLSPCREALEELCVQTAGSDTVYLAGLPVDSGTQAVSAVALLHRGRVAAMLPAAEAPNGLGCGAFPASAPAGAVLRLGRLAATVLPCDPLHLPRYTEQVRQSGAELVIVPAFAPSAAGSLQQVRETVRAFSRALGCAVCVVNGGPGATSHPYVYRGFLLLCECGEELVFETADYEPTARCCDLDADILRRSRIGTAQPAPFFEAAVTGHKSGLLRPVSRNPYLPATEPGAYLSELFALQVRALAARMENTGIERLVLGVSGGLDSTLALLVCAGAADALHLPRQAVLGITMPGFGTTDRTYYNALSLMEALGAESRDIPIRAAVLQHFEDIGHDAAVRDITYENAQARERTQILFDVGNTERALVVGSGDLSEAALGFCTFGGDQLAGYNVNACITKTNIRALTAHLAETEHFAGTAEILRDILETPVSPELLPPDEDGAIVQKTEELLGPYELHDFFLYYFLRYGFRPAKLYYYACVAFGGELDPAFIRDKLRLFLRRFFQNQFKRSAAPDAAILALPCLHGHSFFIPSDLSAAALLREVDAIEPF